MSNFETIATMSMYNMHLTPIDMITGYALTAKEESFAPLRWIPEL